MYSAEVENEELDGPKDLGRRSKVSAIRYLLCELPWREGVLGLMRSRSLCFDITVFLHVVDCK